MDGLLKDRSFIILMLIASLYDRIFLELDNYGIRVDFH